MRTLLKLSLIYYIVKLFILAVVTFGTKFEYWLNDDDTWPYPGLRSYDDAQESCKAWGGYLAIVNEENYEQIFL